MISSPLGPRSTRVYEELRRSIEEGSAPVGMPLPSQSALAKQFGVALMTVRQALLRLENEGLVVARRGAGTFVATNTVSSQEPAMGSLVEDATRVEGGPALRVSDQPFRTVFDYAPSGIVIASLAGDFLKTNGALQHFLGYGEHELRGMNFRQITHPHDMEASSELLQELVSGQRSTFQIEKRYIRRDGTVVWGRLTNFLLHDQEGAPELSVGVIEDITSLKHAEVSLRLWHARFADLFEAVSDIVWIGDLDGRLTEINPAAERVTGYSKKEAEGMTIADIVVSEDVSIARRMLADKLARGGETTYRIRIAARSGRRITVDVRSTLLYEEGAPSAVQGIAKVVDPADAASS